MIRKRHAKGFPGHRYQKISVALIFLGYLALMTTLPLVAQDADTIAVSHLEVYEQFNKLKPDAGQQAAVENFLLRRDVGEFHLKKGRFIFAEEIEGRRYAVIFTGSGEFRYAPPTEIEADHLERFLKQRRLSEKFKSLVIFFGDSTETELRRRLNFGPGKKSRAVQHQLSYALKYLQKKKGQRFDVALMKTVLDDDRNGLFYAQFSYKKTNPLFFDINPYESEEVRFMRRMKGPSYLYLPETINQFHLAEDYHSGERLSDEQKHLIEINDYSIDTRLNGAELKLSADTELRFQVHKDRQRWIYFYLFSDMEVDSAFWGNGAKAMFFKKKDNPLLWVKAPRSLKSGEVLTLRLHYHGKLIDRQKDWFLIRSSRGWYPHIGNRLRANYDLRFEVPKGLTFTSVGKLLSADTLDKVIKTHWRSQTPMPLASFNVGFFENHTVQEDSLPPVTIQMTEAALKNMHKLLVRGGRGSTKDMKGQVAGDVSNSIAFFRKVYGDVPVRHFYATEIPYEHGEAFPGLIHLSWLTFQMTAEEGNDEAFRAHEVAHQWWGIGVDNKTYHDVWLNEGFAEYSGWWYLHHLARREEGDFLKNQEKFLDFIKKWREQITGNRSYLLGQGQKAAPIWLGYRTHSSDTPGDYQLIIYKKGAWVLHMLRMMLMDLENIENDSGDQRFIDLIGSFFQKFRGHRASVEDFKDHAEKHLQEPLDWFFDQWIYGSDIPEYQYAYQVVPADSGGYMLEGRVEQQGVGETFRMPVIVGVEFEKNSSSAGEGNQNRIMPLRTDIRGAASTFTLGPFPQKPIELHFNYLESVLAEVKKKKW